jgi:transposase
MDVHVRNSFLHATEGDGRLLCRGRAGNTLGELAAFLAPLEGSVEPVRVVLESTTNSRAICHLLQQYGKQAGINLQAEVLNARKLRVIAESQAKCDKHDAAVLNELARSNLKLPTCYVPDDEVFALREHLRARADLVRVRTMLKNRVSAVLHHRGILSPLKDLYTKDGRRWLSELELDEAGRTILDRYLAIIDQLKETIEQSGKSLRQLAGRQRWCKPAALLQTMPGVGLVTSLTILAELGDINRFRSRAAVSNFAGFVPVMRDSNDKTFSGHITRRGPSHLRAALVEAAWTSKGRVGQYGALFARVASRKGHQVAIVAVARRMLEDAWTMLKRDEVFRPMSVALAIDERIDVSAAAAAVADPSDAG